MGIKIKTKNISWSKEYKQAQVRKWLMGIMLVAIALTGYAGYMNYFPVYASAEVNVVKSTEVIDNRSVQEHVFDILRDECKIPFEDIITGMAMIETCENPTWELYKTHYNVKFGNEDHGIWMINDYWQRKNFPSQDALKACAYDVYCSTRYACELYWKTGDWRLWSCNKK